MTEEAQAPDPAPAAAPEKVAIHRVLVKPLKSLAPTEGEHLANRLPVIPQEAKDYTPMPYVFRVPCTTFPTKVVKLMARSPPFHLFLDHTIAVIWLLFATNNYDCPLGINQLQWALAFLKTVQPRKCPNDVDICINAIEKLLLKQYAELQADMKEASKLDESVHYGGGAMGSSMLITEDIPFSLNYSEMFIKNPETSFAQQMPTVSMTSVECAEELKKLKEAAGVESILNLVAHPGSRPRQLMKEVLQK